jgi:hypothetical protein
MMPAKPGTPGREISNRNLRSDAALKSGAYSKAIVRPLAEKHFTELLEAYGDVATERELKLDAWQEAQASLAADFVAERGIVRHQRRGEVYPVVQLLHSLTASLQRRYDVYRERQRTRVDDPHKLWREIEAEYADPAD